MDKVSKREILSRIPAVEIILQNPKIKQTQQLYNRQFVVDTIRTYLAELRGFILEQDEIEVSSNIFNPTTLIDTLIDTLSNKSRASLHPVINATGVVVHTNLGRALLADEAAQQLIKIATSYSNLEIDEHSGSRGHRYDHVRHLLCKLTGAEDAMVVNNNAAAVMLSLAGLASGKEVIVSRGEQVEVGGAFRIPDVMAQSGCRLIEVGATNKTYLKDYEVALNSDTGALLKVHTSNYRIVGFTSTVDSSDLARLAHKYDLPIIEDLGSGSLIDLADFGLTHEPTVREIVASGVDVVCFSGDKLLGGPQAGIIVGRKKWIEKLSRHPLNRALRIDKLTLAALEATLHLYQDEKVARENIPVLRMLSLTPEELEQKAQVLQKTWQQFLSEWASFDIVTEFSTVGGGALPLEQIESRVIAIKPFHISTDELDQRLREHSVPVFSRISKERLLIDLRTVPEKQITDLERAVFTVLKDGALL